MKDLKGKWVLVTGAASGIGRAIAIEFAAQGSNVVIADINEQGSAETASLVEKAGVKAIVIRTDMSREDDIRALARDAVAKAGAVDVLVNNAGVAMFMEALNQTWEEWDRILKINLLGPVMLSHLLAPLMVERGSGHIVNIASVAGLMPVPGFAAYTTTKHALVGLSKTLRIELASRGVGVTVVCPGVVNTPILQATLIRGFDESMRTPPASTMITPQKVGKMVVNAVKKNKALIVPSTISTKFGIALSRFSPTLMEMALGGLLKQLKAK